MSDVHVEVFEVGLQPLVVCWSIGVSLEAAKAKAEANSEACCNSDAR